MIKHEQEDDEVVERFPISKPKGVVMESEKRFSSYKWRKIG